MDYEKLLNNLSVKELKDIVKLYMKEVKIVYSKMKKDELIQHILKHTSFDGQSIKSKVVNVGDLKPKAKKEPSRRGLVKALASEPQKKKTKLSKLKTEANVKGKDNKKKEEQTTEDTDELFNKLKFEYNIAQRYKFRYKTPIYATDRTYNLLIRLYNENIDRYKGFDIHAHKVDIFNSTRTESISITKLKDIIRLQYYPYNKLTGLPSVYSIDGMVDINISNMKPS